MSRIHEKSKLLQVLSETPLVSLACKKSGLSRATYYRWYKDDKSFRDCVDKIIDIGRKNINDLAEKCLITEMQKGNLNAARFWLQHNDKRYVPMRTTYVEPIIHYHNLKPGEICYTCGHAEPIDKVYLSSGSAYGEPGTRNEKRLSRKELNKMVLEKKVFVNEDDLNKKFGRENIVEDIPKEKDAKRSAYE